MSRFGITFPIKPYVRFNPATVAGGGSTSPVALFMGELLSGPRVTHGEPGQLPTRERARREKIAAELAELEMRALQNADEDALVEMLMLI